MAQRSIHEIIPIFSELSTDDLRRLNNAIVNEIRHRGQQKKLSFHPGDTVSFKTNTGMRVQGQVAAILRKNIEVHVGRTTWRVSPSLLQLVSR